MITFSPEEMNSLVNVLRLSLSMPAKLSFFCKGLYSGNWFSVSEDSRLERFDNELLRAGYWTDAGRANDFISMTLERGDNTNS